MLLSVDSARGFHDMNTREFIEKLRAAHKRLIVANSDEDAVHPGYYLKEIKADSNVESCCARYARTKPKL
jgi:hypothetical protein